MKFNYSNKMKKLNILLVLFLTLTSTNLLLAQSPPNFPCVFEGTITINGDNTNFEFSTVTAHLESGELANFSYLATENPIGNYAIQIEDAVGSNIIFKINGVDADQEETCTSGIPVLLDLTATISNLQGNFDSENLDLVFGDSVQFKDGEGNIIVSFEFDFNSGILNLSAIKINKTDEGKGSIEISGISLPPGQTKTVYINNTANEDYVCILDEPDAKVSEMTGDCSGDNEITVICDGAVEGYTCTDLGNTLKITGLTYSAVQESSYSPPSPPAPTGSRRSSSSSTTTAICIEDWSCLGWSEECLDGARTRVCTDLNNCGTFASRPAIVQICTAEETQQETGTEAPVTGGVIGALGTGGTVVLAVILIIIVIGLIIIVSRKKK